MFQKIISFKKKNNLPFYQFSGNASELSRIYLDRSFFFGAKNPTIGPFHYIGGTGNSRRILPRLFGFPAPIAFSKGRRFRGLAAIVWGGLILR